jgi:hypothetical protein
MDRSKSRIDCLSTLLLLQLSVVLISGFVQINPSTTFSSSFSSSSSSKHLLFSSAPPEGEDDTAVQWQLFNKHHAKGSWKGVWTTYDFIGDVIDETVASVDLNASGENGIDHTHTIVVGAKRSDCKTCFDSMETKTLPVAQYSPGNLKKSRFAGCSMINGPSLLRSGAMATELVLNHGDGRVRVLFQHAPGTFFMSFVIAKVCSQNRLHDPQYTI